MNQAQRLDIERLNALKPGEVFQWGETVDSLKGINWTGSGRKLRWVAVSGRTGGDWAIYAYWAEAEYYAITQYGDQIHDLDTVRNLVPCANEALARYRH